MKINWFKLKKEYLEKNLINMIIGGNPDDYCCIKIYLKQGYWCKDCEENIFNCECNECSKCKFRFCSCELDVQYKGFGKFNYSFEQRNLIRIKIFYLISKILNKISNINSLILDLNDYQNITDFNEIEENIVLKYEEELKKLYEN